MQTHDFINVFIQPIETLGLRYMVTGSIAAIFYGEPRLTHDIDIVLALSTDDVKPFCAEFDLENYYCPPEDIIFIELRRTHNAHFNLIHHQTGLKADCYLFTGDELHAWAMANRRKVYITEDVEFFLAPCEYVIIRKLQYFDEGGAVKHVKDVLSMLKNSGEQIDMQFLLKELKKRDIAHHLPKS